jgi:outer membrane protein OmpA-like peptidoglycan-associated protein
MVTKKGYLLLSIAALLSISGCGRKKVSKSPKKNHHVAYNNDIFKNVDIPLADQEVALSDEEVTSFFDEETGEFVAYDKQDGQDTLDILTLTQDEINEIQKSDYAWVDADKENEFKKIYFDFDRHNVRPDQKDIVESDILAARALLEEARAQGENPTFIIEGHACKSAGNAVYNTALSQKRAKAVSDFFVSEGVPQENVKIVGRGQDVPVVDGTREQQWPNRRVEVKVIYS